jgi:hypothetical protein
MKPLIIGHRVYPITPSTALDLQAEDFIYACDGAEDHGPCYHINPQNKSLDLINKVLDAIAEGARDHLGSTVPVETVQTSGVISPIMLQSAGTSGLDKLTKTLSRNLAINLGMTLLNRGLVRVRSENGAGGHRLSLSVDALHPAMSSSFAFLAMGFVLSRIKDSELQDEVKARLTEIIQA